jgi:hypothetical protein
MSEDYKQERKWKKALAKRAAEWVVAWHQALDKSLLCVNVCVFDIAP